MKKLLSLTTLVALFALVACGGRTVETVCTIRHGGNDHIVTAQSKDDEIISITHETREDVSDLSADRIDELIGFLAGEGEDCDLDGDTLSCIEMFSEDELRQSHFPSSLEAFIAYMGAENCE